MNKGNELVLLIYILANFIYILSDSISSLMQKLYERPTVCLVLTGEEADSHLRSRSAEAEPQRPDIVKHHPATRSCSTGHGSLNSTTRCPGREALESSLLGRLAISWGVLFCVFFFHSRVGPAYQWLFLLDGPCFPRRALLLHRRSLLTSGSSSWTSC